MVIGASGSAREGNPLMRSGKNAPIDPTEEPVDVEVLGLSKELATVSVFTREDLTNIASYDDAIRIAQEAFGTVVRIDETDMGDGFRVATEDDKRRLVGVPLVLLEWKWRDGDFGKDYCSILAVALNANGTSTKWVINDGGTGIAEDLKAYEGRTGRTGGLSVPKGLRVSDYFTDALTNLPISRGQLAEYHATGRKTGKGHTFYLDTSA